LQIISFWVSVPVLSVIRNWMRPSSSGMFEFRAIAPLIYSSVLMLCEYQSFARSRLTLNEIGMMDESSRIVRNKNMRQSPWNPFRNVITNAKTSKNPNRILDKKLTSISKRQTLDVGDLQFICDRVYAPVNTTRPITKPYDARTVSAHNVFSSVIDSFSLLFWNNPLNSYICFDGCSLYKTPLLKFTMSLSFSSLIPY